MVKRNLVSRENENFQANLIVSEKSCENELARGQAVATEHKPKFNTRPFCIARCFNEAKREKINLPVKNYPHSKEIRFYKVLFLGKIALFQPLLIFWKMAGWCKSDWPKMNRISGCNTPRARLKRRKLSFLIVILNLESC